VEEHLPNVCKARTSRPSTKNKTKPQKTLLLQGSHED
jgi:hypothetical protein